MPGFNKQCAVKQVGRAKEVPRNPPRDRRDGCVMPRTKPIVLQDNQLALPHMEFRVY